MRRATEVVGRVGPSDTVTSIATTLGVKRAEQRGARWGRPQVVDVEVGHRVDPRVARKVEYEADRVRALVPVCVTGALDVRRERSARN